MWHRMSKTIIFLTVMLALLVSMVPTSKTSAQSGLSFTSGVQVVNLSNEVASITIQYFDVETGNPAGSATDAIPVGSSKTYFPLTGVPVGFKGSAVIGSTANITAIANTVTTDFMYGAATNGFSAGSTTFNLPLVMCNNSGFDTWFSVQNAGDSGDANVTITYNRGSHGATGVTEAATISQGGAKVFDQKVGSTTKNCTQLAGADGKFIGSATITSNKPVVATVMQLNTTSFRVLMGYNGFGSASTVVNAPLVMANNSGYYTGIQIQNIGGSSTVVTVDYSPNTAGSFNPADETCSLAAGASCTLIQNGGQWTGKYIGSATITNSAGQNLVAIINQVSLGGGGLGPFGTAYEGFNPVAATGTITMPLIMANNSGYFTGYQVMNVGDTTCNTVSVDYGANTAAGGTFDPANETFSLAAKASKTILQSGSPPSNGSVNNWGASGRYIGSGKITGSGCKLVAIVNQLNPGAGDKFYTYDAYNQ